MRLSNGEVLLRWPLDQHILTQGWKYNNGNKHNGVDLRTQIGNTSVRPVYAAEDGTVSATQLWDGHTTNERSMQSYGNMVDIRHADYKKQSLVTRYAHLFKFIVCKGEKVKEGQLIGYSGATGNVYGAHLHFEVLLGGKRTNPLTWLDDDFTTASSSVYTYGPGEHAVERPAEDKPAAATLQTICASNLTNAQAMAVFSLAIQLRLVAMRLYWAEFSDAEMAHQNIEVGPITQGDAKAVLDKLAAVGAKGTAQAA
ncbi:MAG: M23 family metallopeptidase [Gemmiger sp.]|uniref:M23 family metallopeptidase n=1 Tax=Gemmiger sp. TaxID=2049027 RepID=UPI002A91C6AF|nr:M23 family metallopeptidase [Gemmiger sp.]MDY5410248.1 M23 family metallopeptidase [Gemmiger sp.]